MHLIIDIRTSERYTLIERYASSWVTLWLERHPTDRVSYLHLAHQECPNNGGSLIVRPARGWWTTKIPLRNPDSTEIYRYVSFSPYPIYESEVSSIRHIWDNGSILYPRISSSWFARFSSLRDTHTYRWETIIVPCISVWREIVEIQHIAEEHMEIIPYLALAHIVPDRHILSQLWLTGAYWIHDGTYGSESGIEALLTGYASYRHLGGHHSLILTGVMTPEEMRYMSYQIQSRELMGSVRIIGALHWAQLEALYMSASGWIYVWGYYMGWPRIELARSHHIPLLISDIDAFVDYREWSIVVHPSHLGDLKETLQILETRESQQYSKIPNEALMKWYEKILAEKR